MKELGDFRRCNAQGFEETKCGIFWSVLEGKKPEINHIADFRMPIHPLNYFAVAQYERTTFGLVFDYNENCFSPYIFECDIDTSSRGGIWNCVLDNMVLDDMNFEFDEFASFEELEQLLEDDLSHYDLTTWFYALATVGYLNFHGKPSIMLQGIDKIKYEYAQPFPPLHKTSPFVIRIDGYKQIFTCISNYA